MSQIKNDNEEFDEINDPQFIYDIDQMFINFLLEIIKKYGDGYQSFQLFLKNSNSVITYSEFQQALKEEFQIQDEATVQSFFKWFDQDNDGKVTHNDWIDLFQKFDQEKDLDEEQIIQQQQELQQQQFYEQQQQHSQQQQQHSQQSPNKNQNYRSNKNDKQNDWNIQQQQVLEQEDEEEQQFECEPIEFNEQQFEEEDKENEIHKNILLNKRKEIFEILENSNGQNYSQPQNQQQTTNSDEKHQQSTQFTPSKNNNKKYRLTPNNQNLSLSIQKSQSQKKNQYHNLAKTLKSCNNLSELVSKYNTSKFPQKNNLEGRINWNERIEQEIQLKKEEKQLSPSRFSSKKIDQVFEELQMQNLKQNKNEGEQSTRNQSYLYKKIQQSRHQNHSLSSFNNIIQTNHKNTTKSILQEVQEDKFIKQIFQNSEKQKETLSDYIKHKADKNVSKDFKMEYFHLPFSWNLQINDENQLNQESNQQIFNIKTENNNRIQNKTEISANQRQLNKSLSKSKNNSTHKNPQILKIAALLKEDKNKIDKNNLLNIKVNKQESPRSLSKLSQTLNNLKSYQLKMFTNNNNRESYRAGDSETQNSIQDSKYYQSQDSNKHIKSSMNSVFDNQKHLKTPLQNKWDSYNSNIQQVKFYKNNDVDKRDRRFENLKGLINSINKI